MKPHPRGTELKVGTTRHFTQPTPEVESDAEADKLLTRTYREPYAIRENV